MDLHLYSLHPLPHHKSKIDLPSSDADSRIMDLDVLTSNEEIRILVGDSCGQVTEVIL